MVVAPDWVLYASLAGMLGALVAWGLAVATAPRRVPARPQERGEHRSEESHEKPEHISLDNVLGLDVALAAKFYRQLRKALASGEVKVALVSDKCPDGYVAYDFVREDWICVERDGTSHRLGENVVAEHLEIEEEPEEFGVAEDGG